MVGFALFINRTPPIFIVIMCALATAFNLLVLPVLTNKSLRYNTKSNSDFGLVAYPLVLFIVSLLFFKQLEFLAIGWAMMAFGDGFASIIGGYVRSAPLPWSKSKTFAGFLSFIIFGTVGTFLLLEFVPSKNFDRISHIDLMLLLLLVALAGAFIESFDTFVDDNIPVVLVTSILSYGILHLNLSVVIPPPNMLMGLLFSFVFSLLAYISKSLSLTGAILGFLVATSCYLGFGWYGMMILALFVIGGIGSTRWRKQYVLLQEDNSPRDYKNVGSNGLVPLLIALFAFLSGGKDPLLWIYFTSAFCAALSDTVSSEIGTLYGKYFYTFPFLKKGGKGEDGNVSVEGTVAGFMAALIMAALVFYLSNSIFAALIILAAGFTGNLCDSLFGTLFQKRGLMTNHSVNIANTAMAVLTAYLLLSFFEIIFNVAGSLPEDSPPFF
jgi:uncharacterized protein (TIGR00297 family)